MLARFQVSQNFKEMQFLSMGLDETAKLLPNVGKQKHTVTSQT
jgi:hypothetical protein